MASDKSIFQEYYDESMPFHDRFATNPDRAVTVIIPTIHTNEIWKANLKSIYREIPVARLLLGDGGCIDGTVAIAEQFPRVEVHDHRAYKSLGYSIRKLIEAVETEWFIYLHSDVYLPPGWFDEMYAHQGQYDWFGCRMRHTVMLEYDHDYGMRPYAGSQMGRKSAFVQGLHRIDDDYVYRQEDFVFADIIAKSGFKEGKVESTFHYHQTIKKPSPFWNPKYSQIKFSATLSREEEIRVWDSQSRGIIKYLTPSSDWVIHDACYGIHKLIKLKHIAAADIYKWIAETNPVWTPLVKRGVFWLNVRGFFRQIAAGLKNPARFFRA